MTAFLVSLSLALAAPVPKDKTDEEFLKKADTARTKAVKYLKEKQDKAGGWESVVLSPIVGQKGGATALAILGLLEAGVPANDPAIVKAVEFLLVLKPDKTYVVSLHTQVLARVDAKKYAKEIQANADWLMSKTITKNGKLEGWSYPINHIADNSNTHFAIMGLHAAAQAGAKVDAEIWRKIRDYFADTQKANGGWTYGEWADTHATQSMTTAALVALAVATKYDKQAKGPDPAFEKGMVALLKGELEDGKNMYYILLTTAELGRALGTTEFKSGKLTKAWYREGVEKMVKKQQEDGSIIGGEDRERKTGIDDGQPIITTACGLYFLGAPAKK